jgi:Flp pilus assembly protein TadD
VRRPRDVRVAAKGGAPAPADDAGDPKVLADEGSLLFKNGRLKEASAALKRCISVDPEYARCHKLLGATYARLNELEKGAEHYRLFLKLAPMDPQAEQVRTLLDAYSSRRKNH